MMKTHHCVLAFLCVCLSAGWVWPAETTDDAETSETLKPFGYDVFRGELQDISEAPVDQDYRVGPRDELLIETWGEYVKQYPVRVSVDGYIDLEAEELRIFINGLTLREVEEKITREMSRIHSSIFNWEKPTESKAWVSVIPTRVRNILVYVSGEVVKPGTYSINPTVSSLINVLSLSGGIKNNGSLRRVRVSRTDRSTQTYDLYDFLVQGETEAVKSRLQYGETVFVDLKRKSVSITGVVRRPGIYEVLDNESLRDLLDYAGGPGPGAYLKRIQITRRALNRGLQKLDVDFALLQDEGTTFPLLDGDVVEIFPSVEEEYVVYLEGAGVFQTGVFQFTEGMTLVDLIDKGEGLRGEAYLEKCDLVRTRTDYTLEYMDFTLKELYQVDEETGKVEHIGEKNSPMNFPLRRLDRIKIYSYFEITGKDKFVTLEGYVKEPGEHRLAKNMTLYDLLFAYGGFEDPDWRRETYLERAEVWRTSPEDQRTTLIAVSLRRVLEEDPKENIELRSQDRIVIFSYDEIVEKYKYVTLEGHVKQPGDHLLTANMTISDLLATHGGFEDADWRKETYLDRATLWRRNTDNIGQTEIPINLRKALAKDPENDLLLQSRDRLVVWEYRDFYPQAYFTINGAVRQPGQYRLAQNTTLNDAIVAARGLLDEAYKYEAEVVRSLPADVSADESSKVFRVPVSEDYATSDRGAGFSIVKDDAIYIRTVPGWGPPRKVVIAGEVQFPGEFILTKPAERVSEVIRRAGGLSKTAYPIGAVLTRYLDDGSTQGKRSRVAIRLAQALAQPGSEADLVLRKGDELDVPINPMTVEVRGAVRVPAVLQHKPGRRVSDYVDLCGGYSRYALRRETLVEHPDGTMSFRGWGWFQTRPPAGSMIVVPSEGVSVAELLNINAERPTTSTATTAGLWHDEMDLDSAVYRIPSEPGRTGLVFPAQATRLTTSTTGLVFPDRDLVDGSLTSESLSIPLSEFPLP